MALHHDLPSRRQALLTLVEDARHEAALSPASSPSHDFFAGVRAAAEDKLFPSRPASRPAGWLAKESAAFRDGYAKATAILASERQSHGHYHLPQPD